MAAPPILDEEEEKALLRGLRQGDPAAFNAIYHHFSRTIYTAAYNYGRDPELAREVVQEVFIALWERRQTLVVLGRLNHYLYGAARNQIYHALDRSNRTCRYLARAAQQPEGEETTGQQVAFNETMQLIENQLTTLSTTTREIFLMSRFEGLSVKQIAESLSLSAKAVEYHITKALKVLRVGLGNLSITLLLLLFTRP